MVITVALIGNPNVGKTVIFNNLTGAKQHVANWPGVTVEKKEGKCSYNGIEIHIVDLPGCYSLTARSIDEKIARNFIIDEKPDVVLDIIDATNLERNLYLTLLLMELDVNLVIAFNMWDVVESSKNKLDVKKISEKLGVPIVTTAAIKHEGMNELKKILIESANKNKSTYPLIKYKPEIEEKISQIQDIIKNDKNLCDKYTARWLAIKALEGDKIILENFRKSDFYDKIMEVID